MILTINILVKNNQDTIKNTLESIKELDANILVGNFGCKDDTVKICNLYKAKIIPIPLNDSFSDAKNIMIKENKSPWIMFIEPWETILSPIKEIISLINGNPNSYNFKIIQNDLMTKDTRLWHTKNKLQFKNPVFETISEKSNDSEVCLVSHKNNLDETKINLVKKWREKFPLASEPLYYLSCVYLIEKNWGAFLNTAETYLYREKNKNMSWVMTKYYCSMVRSYVSSEKDYKSAVSSILQCIAEKPLMAEFWCLLGDIYYATNEYKKAICFYENAMILGSKRLHSDNWPMEISKYKEYPNKMIDACRIATSSLQVYTGSASKENQVR
jgi:tetratricopeptide (TPR) repeat protein